MPSAPVACFGWHLCLCDSSLSSSVRLSKPVAADSNSAMLPKAWEEMIEGASALVQKVIDQESKAGMFC